MAQSPAYATLERVGRIRLSENFFMRDFLYSEVAAYYGIANLPDNEKLAAEVGTALCENLLEPMQKCFGRLHIRSAFRSCAVNAIGNRNNHNCASNEANYAGHIWDRVDGDGRRGATACIVIPGFADRFTQPGDWTELAWWLHDNLPYCSLYFFPQNWAFNITWSDKPRRRIDSYAGWQLDGGWKNKGLLTEPGMANHEGDHTNAYSRLEQEFGL